MEDSDTIQIIGACENNLKNISVSLPQNSLVLVGGRSGSGKTSLLVDILHAESQRIFFQTLSSYARQFLEKIKRPNCLAVRNLRPSLCVLQSRNLKNSRSSVATLTHIIDDLKNLMIAFGDYVCPSCGKRLESTEPEKVVLLIKEILEKRDCLYLCGRLQASNTVEARDFLFSQGISRVFYKGKILDLDDPSFEAIEVSEALALVDRLTKEAFCASSVQQSVDAIFNIFDNEIILIAKDFVQTINRQATCDCNKNLIRSEELFNSNSSLAACKSCKGFGYNLIYDLAKIIDENKPLLDGGIKIWEGENAKEQKIDLKNKLLDFKLPLTATWNNLNQIQKEILLKEKSSSFWGIFPWLEWMESKRYKMHVRAFLSKFRSEILCEVCKGTGFSEETNSFRLFDKSLGDLYQMEISELESFFSDKLKKFRSSSPSIDYALDSLNLKLQTLVKFGLGHLKLSRKVRTLSGGEVQRLTLCGALTNPLAGLQIILDEPSAGLSDSDLENLIQSLKELRDRGNSVFVIEHDLAFFRASDHVVLLGPDSGTSGGEIIYSGKFSDAPKDFFQFKLKRTKLPVSDFFIFHNFRKNNLDIDSLRLAKNSLNVLVGVSGSGKSSLLEDLASKVSSAIFVNQSFVPKNSRSTVASYLGVWAQIRNFFAKESAFEAKHFSFNSKTEGRCSECGGLGYIREDLIFLPDIKITCPKCNGKRYSEKILKIKVNNLTIVDVLNLTVKDALSVLDINDSSLTLCNKLGLGHLKLGQSLSEVSRGEAQRLRLIRELSDFTDETLVLMDEPSVGLHIKDIQSLLDIFDWLLSRGATLLVAEHNKDIIELSDYVIQLGPGSGSHGGKLLYSGPPEDFLKMNKSNNLPNYAPSKELSKFNSSCLTLLQARQRNLKIDRLEVPYNKIVCFTGPSGSGKSSLVFETIFAESQRHFLSTLSPYTLSFLDIHKKPSLDAAINLRAAVSLEQYYSVYSSLSSLGTLTGIVDYLRLLFAKVGIQKCPEHLEPIVAATTSSVAKSLAALKDPCFFLVPLVRGRKGNHNKLIRSLEQSDWEGAVIDGIFVNRSSLSSIKLDRSKDHWIDAVHSKCVPARLPFDVLQQTIEDVFKQSDVLKVLNLDTRQELVFNKERACPVCGRGVEALDPEDFSFSSKRGWCSACKGKGLIRGKTCHTCQGSGLSLKALAVEFRGKNLKEICNMRISELLEFFRTIKVANEIEGTILYEIVPRLESLINLGLGYLSLNRRLISLSSGELQRARLSTVMNTNLRDLIVVLDEPTASLHPLDMELVFKELSNRKSQGNSIFMIEHDPYAIQSSDYIIELGPKGGKEGGKLCFSGPVTEYLKLKGELFFDLKCLPNFVNSSDPKQAHSRGFILIKSSKINNLDINNLKIPLNSLVVVGGVSGSGKTSLVKHTIYSSFYHKSKQYDVKIQNASIKNALYVDQTLISGNIRATPVSYLGIWEKIRDLYSRLPKSRARGFTKSCFSFNNKKFACPECKGSGLVTFKLGFLETVRVPCQRCGEKRFKPELLEITFNGKSIADVLKMTFKEAFKFFAEFKEISRVCSLMIEIGMDYLVLGQPLSSLSGGENQRLKLVKELLVKRREKILYLLDEPTLGLHQADVDRLIKIVRKLVDQGNSVIVVEHDPKFIIAADFFIELGPGAEQNGGKVIFADDPRNLPNSNSSVWATILSERDRSRSPLKFVEA